MGNTNSNFQYIDKTSEQQMRNEGYGNNGEYEDDQYEADEEEEDGVIYTPKQSDTSNLQ